MTTERAMQIVFELANENVLTPGEILQDPEVLQPIATEQQDALNVFHDFVVNNIH